MARRTDSVSSEPKTWPSTRTDQASAPNTVTTANAPTEVAQPPPPADLFHTAKTAAIPASALPAVPPQKEVNHGKNVSWTPKYAFRPGKDIEQLSEVMTWVSRHLSPDVKIKAGGSRHSWSPVAATDGVYIHPEDIKFIESVPASELRAQVSPETREHLVRIGSGTTIKQINQELWAQGKALPYLGGFDGQTIGGVLPTGTHGSVLKYGPLAEMVRSMDLVKADGGKVRIEPKNGMTDPVAFARTHPDWELKQDDDTFNASLISMGTLGVVHSLVLEDTDKFYLNEIRTETTGTQAEQVLTGENIYRLMETDRGAKSSPPKATFAGHPTPAYHMELLWNPNSDKMVVTTRQPVDEKQQKAFEEKEPKAFTKSPVRNLFRSIPTNKKYERPDLITWVTEHFGKAITDVSEHIEHTFPKAAPKLVDQALESMKDGGYVNRSYNVFNIGDAANQLPAQSATISVPLRGDMYLRAMDVIRKTAAELGEKNDLYQTGPISLRFVKGSKALLGDPEDVCKFEIIFSGDDEKAQKLSKQMVGAYYEALNKEFGANVRFHWGQLIPESFADKGAEHVSESFPGAAKFEQVRREIDPQGHFTNPWQERFLGSTPSVG